MATVHTRPPASPLRRAVAAFMAIIALVAVIAALGSGPQGLRATVGRVDDFPVGSITPLEVAVKLTRSVPRVSDTAESDVVDVPIFLVNDAQEGLLALYAADPHLGCRVGLASDLAPEAGVSPAANVVFFNPCHGEQYDVLGRHITGPAPRGLDRFGVVIAGSDVIVDIGAFEYGPRR